MQKIHSELNIKIFNKDKLSVTAFSFAFAWRADPDGTILRMETFLPPCLFFTQKEENIIMQQLGQGWTRQLWPKKSVVLTKPASETASDELSVPYATSHLHSSWLCVKGTSQECPDCNSTKKVRSSFEELTELS